MRAHNQTFHSFDVKGKPPETEPVDEPPGPVVTDKAGNETKFRFPWVYMGPGIFFNQKSKKVRVGVDGRRHFPLSPGEIFEDPT